MMRLILCSLLCLLLVGCGADPGVRVEFVDRPVVVVQHCVKNSDIPVVPTRLKDGVQPTDLEQALSLSLAKVSEWVRYGNKTDEILKQCVK